MSLDIQLAYLIVKAEEEAGGLPRLRAIAAPDSRFVVKGDTTIEAVRSRARQRIAELEKTRGACSYREWVVEVDRIIAATVPGKRAKDIALFDGRSLWRNGWTPEAWANALLAKHRRP